MRTRWVWRSGAVSDGAVVCHSCFSWDPLGFASALPCENLAFEAAARLRVVDAQLDS